MSGRIAASLIGPTPRVVTLTPDFAARATLARRLLVPEISALTCRFVLSRDRFGAPVAQGVLDAVVVQEDVTTLCPFAAAVTEAFTLRFVPEGGLAEVIDPDDPVDEVSYDGTMIDLHEALCEQLALALDPYPHQPSQSPAA